MRTISTQNGKMSIAPKYIQRVGIAQRINDEKIFYCWVVMANNDEIIMGEYNDQEHANSKKSEIEIAMNEVNNENPNC